MNDNMIKSIKEELFFIWRLFDPRHTPTCAFKFSCYYQYFKNRFFSRMFLNKLESYNYIPDQNFEIHTLTQKRDIWMLVWALRSFLYFSGLRPKIIIHDDGSFDEKTALLIKSKFSAVDVIMRKEADQEIYSRKLPPLVVEYRQKGHPMIIKLIDIFLFSRAKSILLLDSDTLLFKKPQEIIDFINQDEIKVLASMGKEEKNKKLCAGFFLFKKDILKMEALINYLETKPEPDDFFVEQNGWEYITSKVAREFLDPDTYKIKGRVDENTIMKHFTNPRRHEMFAYGIDMVRYEFKKH